jgi:hypothetical protein
VRPGSSDVDLLSIDLPDAAVLGRRLSARYADRCRGVEVAAATAAGFAGDTDSAYGGRVVVLCVLAQALTAAFRLRLPGNYAHATPDTLQRRFLDTPGEISSDSAGITVKINRRAYSPVLRGADPPADTTVPWWDGRQLRFEFA